MGLGLRAGAEEGAGHGEIVTRVGRLEMGWGGGGGHRVNDRLPALLQTKPIVRLTPVGSTGCMRGDPRIAHLASGSTGCMRGDPRIPHLASGSALGLSAGGGGRKTRQCFAPYDW